MFDKKAWDDTAKTIVEGWNHDEVEQDRIRSIVYKATPRQPVNMWHRWLCPTCQREVELTFLSGTVYREHHCACGQAIDWSEIRKEEEENGIQRHFVR